MSKLKGSYKSANNIEVITSHPLDPRVRWDSWDSLTNKNDWPTDNVGNPYLYSGLVVSVNEGTESNPNWKVYILNDINGWDKPFGTDGTGWVEISSGGGQGVYWEEDEEQE